MGLPRTSSGAALGLAVWLGAALGGAVLMTTGCADDEPGTQARRLVVAVRDRDSGAAVPGVKVVVLDADNRPVAPPARTDTNGSLTPAIASDRGPFFVLAFPGDSLFVHAFPPPIATLSLRAPLAPAGDPTAPQAAATAAPPVLAEVLVGRRTEPGGLPRIAGTVVDAVTQEPLAAAFVSLSPYLTGYLGRIEVSDDVTLADGAFRVSEIPFAPDPNSGELRQVVPLIVTCTGYRPRTWRHEPRPGDDNLDIAGAVIALEREASGSGKLSGLVTFQDEPVAGVVVGLGGFGAAAGKSAVGRPGRVAVTDSSGRYVFDALPPGGYVVQPGYRPDDPWHLPGQPGNRVWTVAAADSVEAAPLAVVRTIRPLWPPDSASLSAPLDSLTWTAVAAADSYKVYLDDRGVARTAAASVGGLDLDLAPGWHVWSVVGITNAGVVVGYTEIPPRVRVVESTR